MSWAYRIIDFGNYMALHEVYFSAEGKPEGYTKDPAMFHVDTEDETVDGIIRSLAMAIGDSVKFPPIKLEEFPK